MSDRQIDAKSARITELKKQLESVEKSIEPLLIFAQELGDKIDALQNELDRDMGYYNSRVTPGKANVALFPLTATATKPAATHHQNGKPIGYAGYSGRFCYCARVDVLGLSGETIYYKAKQ